MNLICKYMMNIIHLFTITECKVVMLFLFRSRSPSWDSQDPLDDSARSREKSGTDSEK